MNFALNYYVAALYEFMLCLLLQEMVFVKGYQKREKYRLRSCVGFTGYLLSGVILLLLFQRGIFNTTAILMYLLVYVFSCLVLWNSYELKFVDLLYASSCGYAAQHIGSSLGAMVRYLTDLDHVHPYLRYPIGILIQLVIALLMYVFVVQPHLHEGEQKEKDPRMVSLAIIVLVATIILSTQTDGNPGELYDARALFLSGVICKSYGILLCMLIISMEFFISRMNHMEQQKLFMEGLIKKQAEQQKLSNESIAIINRKCHDMKYQMRLLKRETDEEKRSEYIDELRKAVAIYDSVYHTGNDALDMLLREKTLLCEEYEIQFSCMADGSVLNFMPADDIYVLLGNALDNAIEAVIQEEDLERRVISLSITRKQGMPYIHLENYSKERHEFRDGLPQTTKEDKNYHGFGVQSIQYLSEKYGGTMVMQEEDMMFCLDILFPKQR